MLIDSRALPEGSTVEADVCIVGGGPAGLTIARELAGSGLDVAVLESGGLERDLKTSRLMQGERAGYPYYRLDRTRERYLGGASNHWLPDVGLRARPLDPIDFEARSWLPYSGWPFDKAHLDPYYARAQEVCGLGRYSYDAADWQQPGERQSLRLGDEVNTVVFQFGPRTRFQHLSQTLAASPQVKFYLHANVMQIETAETGHVSRLLVGCLDGRRFWARAKTYVLAAGGLENPRLLLLSNATQPSGLGNQHDLVGRFFMEHLGLRSGFLKPAQAELIDQAAFYRMHVSQDVRVMGMLALPEEVLRREHLPNVTFFLEPAQAERYSPAMLALTGLISAARDRRKPSALGRSFGALVRGPKDLARSLPVFLRRQPANALHLGAMAEQTPNLASRVTLTNRIDSLGLRQLRLDWRIAQADMDAIIRAQRIIKNAVENAALGEVYSLIDTGFESLASPRGQWHHMGTTRMHADPLHGVVGADCRVHGVSNLYVAGSSVFPTGGYANPTLTLIALALRLADTLRTRLKDKGPSA